MICYKDKAFCIAPCTQHKCPYMLTDTIEFEAETTGLPIAMQDYRDTCEDFVHEPDTVNVIDLFEEYYDVKS